MLAGERAQQVGVALPRRDATHALATEVRLEASINRSQPLSAVRRGAARISSALQQPHSASIPSLTPSPRARETSATSARTKTMANFAPLVGEALPAYGLPRPAFPYEEGDANKSTPHMKWLPINYARPAKCNDFLTLRGAGECYARLRPILEGCRRVLELANGETVGVGSAAAPKGAEARSIRMRWPAFNSQRERKLEVVDDKGMAVSAFDGDSVEKLFASTERDTIAVVDAVIDVGCSDEMLRAMHENRQAIDAYFEKVRRLLAPSGKLVVISCNRIEGVGGPSLACVAEARGWNVVTSFAQNEVIDVVVYEPRPGPTPPAPLPPEPTPDQGTFAQRNLRLRIAPEEYCPAWPDDEEEDNPLPGWVEGDSLAPYVGSDPSMLSEALTYAWLTPLDVVCDVGCGDGRFVTTAVQKLGAERGYGLDIDAELVTRAQDLARRRGVGHRTTFIRCDCSQPSPEVWKILDECTLLIMYLLPEALQQVRPIIDKHLSGPMLGHVPQDQPWPTRQKRILCVGWAPPDLRYVTKKEIQLRGGGTVELTVLDSSSPKLTDPPEGRLCKL